MVTTHAMIAVWLFKHELERSVPIRKRYMLKVMGIDVFNFNCCLPG